MRERKGHNHKHGDACGHNHHQEDEEEDDEGGDVDGEEDDRIDILVTIR